MGSTTTERMRSPPALRCRLSEAESPEAVDPELRTVICSCKGSHGTSC